MDEARVGQQGTRTRIWAKRGTRPRAVRDHRYTWAYLFGAVCPKRGVGAAVVMPTVNVEAMNIHLAEISLGVSVGAHAVLVLDGAGWHTSPKLQLPTNISLLQLPRSAPELNPVESLWEFLRANLLSHRVWEATTPSPTPAAQPGMRLCAAQYKSPPSRPALGHRSKFKAIGMPPRSGAAPSGTRLTTSELWRSSTLNTRAGCPGQCVAQPFQASTASGVNHTVRLPQARRPAPYSAQLVTRCCCFGMW